MPSALFRSRLRAVILLAVVTWACAGNALWQGARTVHYRWVRAENTRRVRDTILVTPNSNAVWIEGDELRFEGRMFDVYAKVQVAGGWRLVGHYDEVDDQLFGLLHAIFDADVHARDDGKRIGVFLPEAVLVSEATLSGPRVLSVSPPHNAFLEEHWRTTSPAAPDMPPEEFWLLKNTSSTPPCLI